MSAPGARWFFGDHTGDVAVVVEAANTTLLFETAAQALFGVIVDTESIEPREVVPVRIGEAADVEDLLVRFLSELLFLHDARSWLFREARVLALGPGSVEAEAIGEKFDPDRHAILRQVKAVTYHGLSVVATEHGVSARLVLDL